MSLLHQSSQYRDRVQTVIDRYQLDRLGGISWELSGSMKYNLMLPGYSDVDLVITTDQVKQVYARVVDACVQLQFQQALFKKLTTNNLYDAYPRFDAHKTSQLGRETDRRFVIELQYYRDDSLSESICLQYGITQTHSDEYDRLCDLDDDHKEQLLQHKLAYYQDHKYDVSRQIKVYDGFKDNS